MSTRSFLFSAAERSFFIGAAVGMIVMKFFGDDLASVGLFIGHDILGLNVFTYPLFVLLFWLTLLFWHSKKAKNG